MIYAPMMIVWWIIDHGNRLSGRLMDCIKYVATPYLNLAALFIDSTTSSTTSRGGSFNGLTSATREYEAKMNLANKKDCKMQHLAVLNMVREGQSTLPL